MVGNEVGVRTLEHLRGERELLMERRRVAETKRLFGASEFAYWLCNGEKRRVRTFWLMLELLQADSRMPLTQMATAYYLEKKSCANSGISPARPQPGSF